jgi:hypothetical protein
MTPTTGPAGRREQTGTPDFAFATVPTEDLWLAVIG